MADSKKPLDTKAPRENDQLHAALWQDLQKYLLTSSQLTSNSYPREHPTGSGRAVVRWNRWDEARRMAALRLGSTERKCDRCDVTFSVDGDGNQTRKSNCVFHYVRPNKMKVYSCCGERPPSRGCDTATCHVAETFDPRQITGFVKTPKSDETTPERVYALDTEMVFTKLGRELARVTLIGPDMKVVYDQFVKPEDPIIDYNTRMSGIRESDMLTVTISLSEVQDALRRWISSSTVLIGHSLDVDMKSLKLFHDSVVDTSVVFPYKPGFKYGLKQLASDHLNRTIQKKGSVGHDSTEDARTCMELMIWKVNRDNGRSSFC